VGEEVETALIVFEQVAPPRRAVRLRAGRGRTAGVRRLNERRSERPIPLCRDRVRPNPNGRLVQTPGAGQTENEEHSLTVYLSGHAQHLTVPVRGRVELTGLELGDRQCPPFHRFHDRLRMGSLPDVGTHAR
jgi:hypothetical protein